MNKAKELSKMKKKAFKLWSEKVRSVGSCELCGKKYKELNDAGKPTILQAHHVIGRENKNLAWDVTNGVCLCSFCHKWSRTGAHRGSIIFNEWYRLKYPEKYSYLLNNWDKEVDVTIEFLQEKINLLSK